MRPARRRPVFLLVPLLALSVALFAAEPGRALRTTAEATGYETTGRYAEAVALCDALEGTHPGRARCVRFGTSPEQRPMVALVASADGVLDAAAARATGRPVIVIQGGIHAGEIDGKDAGFEVLRDALAGGAGREGLRGATVVFIPVLNVDGHERFGPCQRPNQRGPRECGWRTTAQNLNLNRDYAKAEAPETQALLRLLDAWDPVLYVDLHVTDGAKFQHDVALIAEPSAPPHPLSGPARRLRDELLASLIRAGHLPLGFYPAFRSDDDPSSGIAVGTAGPLMSHPYWGWRDRIGLLVETHSWRPYAQRVRTTRTLLVALLEIAARDAAVWRAAIHGVDEAALAIGGREVDLAFKTGDDSTLFDFQGYAYDRSPSPVSGGQRVRYDESRPEVWKVPVFASLVPLLTVRAPGGGYVVPPAHASWVKAKLELHGFETVLLGEARVATAVEVWRAREVTFATRPYEGRMWADARGAWTPERRDVKAGSLFVPVGQSGARLLVHLLEPEAPESLVSWGYFNAVFEQKEYMESYVAEEAAEEMLRADPALRSEFERVLASSPDLAKDPARRLDFFYRRHPSWDERKDEYPIVRVGRVP
jgi:hypothetical protein